MLPVALTNGHGYVARITPHGELVVSPAAPNQSRHNAMTVVDTAYNFAEPISGKKMRVQNILLYANKSVGVNDATVTIYTANAADSVTIIDTIMVMEIPKYGSRDLINLNLELPEGVYLNAKTDDATVYATMMGYYLDV